jgi:predicted HTH transcriptional regulator
MFMMLGRAEKAGSGVDKIVSGWKYLGWPVPTVAEESRPDYVVLTLQLGKQESSRQPKKTTQGNDTRKQPKKTTQEKVTRPSSGHGWS